MDYSSILNIKTNSSTRDNSQRIIIDNSRWMYDDIYCIIELQNNAIILINRSSSKNI